MSSHTDSKSRFEYGFNLVETKFGSVTKYKDSIINFRNNNKELKIEINELELSTG